MTLLRQDAQPLGPDLLGPVRPRAGPHRDRGSGRPKRREPRGPIRLDDALRGMLEGQGRAIQRLERPCGLLERTDKSSRG